MNSQLWSCVDFLSLDREHYRSFQNGISPLNFHFARWFARLDTGDVWRRAVCRWHPRFGRSGCRFVFAILLVARLRVPRIGQRKFRALEPVHFQWRAIFRRNAGGTPLSAELVVFIPACSSCNQLDDCAQYLRDWNIHVPLDEGARPECRGQFFCRCANHVLGPAFFACLRRTSDSSRSDALVAAHLVCDRRSYCYAKGQLVPARNVCRRHAAFRRFPAICVLYSDCCRALLRITPDRAMELEIGCGPVEYLSRRGRTGGRAVAAGHRSDQPDRARG